MQESALSLYARNFNPEDKEIITILLDNPLVCTMMHSRNAYEEPPLQIALKNNKSQLVIAMLDKTDDLRLKNLYSDKEIATITKMKNKLLANENQDNHTFRI